MLTKYFCILFLPTMLIGFPKETHAEASLVGLWGFGSCDDHEDIEFDQPHLSGPI